MKMRVWLFGGVALVGFVVACQEPEPAPDGGTGHDQVRTEETSAGGVDPSSQAEASGGGSIDSPAGQGIPPARLGADLPRGEITLTPSGDAERKAYDEARSRAEREFDGRP